MSIFFEANQARLALKMKLSQYSWYVSSIVANEKDGYSVLVIAKLLNNQIKKIIPAVHNGVSIKVDSLQ